MKVDLHVHSYYSDGYASIDEILQEASRRNITHISIVDHDTVHGLAAIQKTSLKYDVTVIPGVEISAYDFKRNRKVHILGYAFRQDAPNIRALCTPLLQKRHENSLWQIEQLKKHGFAIERDEIKEKAKMSGVIYKQHIMACLTNADFASEEYQTLYQKLFKGQGICAKDIEYVDATLAVQAIKADGGLAVLAHPGQLDSFDMIPELIGHGLDGIERNHPEHTEEDRLLVEKYAEQYALIQTGGSDFHDRYGHVVKIGEEISPVENFNCGLEITRFVM